MSTDLRPAWDYRPTYAYDADVTLYWPDVRPCWEDDPVPELLIGHARRSALIRRGRNLDDLAVHVVDQAARRPDRAYCSVRVAAPTTGTEGQVTCTICRNAYLRARSE